MKNRGVRYFLIGSEWIYFKIYCGVKTSDKILIEIKSKAINGLLSQGLIDKWFFIRYWDPEPHLRIRFHMENPNKIGLVINEFSKVLYDLFNEDYINEVQVDTYKRELERYGDYTIESIENFFYYNSEIVSELISYREMSSSEDIGWLFSLYYTNYILDSFNYDLKDKLRICELLKTNFETEFKINKALRVQLDQKYRNKRKVISTIFPYKDSEIESEYLLLFKNITFKYDEKIQGLLNIIREELIKNKADINLNSLTCSIIHMLNNRLFRSKNRQYELVCYNFLFKIYKSELARKKQKN